MQVLAASCEPVFAMTGKQVLGADYMSQASPVSRAEFSHENLFMTMTDNFNQLYNFLTTKLS